VLRCRGYKTKIKVRSISSPTIQQVQSPFGPVAQMDRAAVS
jgi:hypothetical protein